MGASFFSPFEEYFHQFLPSSIELTYIYTFGNIKKNILKLGSTARVYMLLNLHNSIHPDEQAETSFISIGISDMFDSFDVLGGSSIILRAGLKTVARVTPSVFQVEPSVRDESIEVRGCRLQEEQLEGSKFKKYSGRTCVVEQRIRQT